MGIKGLLDSTSTRKNTHSIMCLDGILKDGEELGKVISVRERWFRKSKLKFSLVPGNQVFKNEDI